MSRQAVFLSVWLAVGIVAVATFKACNRPVEFTNLAIARKHCESLGFHCVLLRPGKMESLVVADHPLTEDEAIDFDRQALHAKKVGMVRLNLSPTQPMPDSENARVIHKLYVIGDPKIIDAIVKSLR
jgi:hypothetical protein